MFPRYLSDMYDPFAYRYGMGLVPSLLVDSPSRTHSNVFSPLRQTSVTSKGADILKHANQFKVMVNVKQFRPEEIEVKIVDNFIVIHCKHEEHADEHGFVSREFTRRYQLPDDVKPQTVKSSLSQDGVLTITAPRKVVEPPPKKKNERVVPITIQQPAAVEEARKRQEIRDQQGNNKSNCRILRN